VAPNTKILEKTKYIHKKLFPSFYWFHTFCVKQNGARKMYEKIEIKTND
jgi:hypothetical protein